MTGPAWEVLGSRRVFDGAVFHVDVDRVRMPDGSVKERDLVRHPGAVGVVALDEEDRVLLIRQYRHAVGAVMTELPAGLLDVGGEPASAAAARELAEEAGVRAARWDVLVDAHTTAGMSDEAVRVFLAREVSPAPATGFALVDEEADLDPHWVPLAEALAQVRAGTITNSLAVMGLLAAAAARDAGFAGLRPASAAWPARPDHAG